MRLPFVAVLGFFAFTFSLHATVDLNGTWVVDLKASDSPDPILKRLGVAGIEREIADSAKVQAVYRLEGDVLNIQTKGPAFSRAEQFHLNGQPESKNESITGPYSVRTSWSADGKQLISTSLFRTKDGKDATLRVTRQLIDGGQTLVLSQALSIPGEAPMPAVRRVWHRKA